MSIAANHIKLRDGRNLGYAEYGDPQGRPVLHMHGFPSSRFEGSPLVLGEIARKANARILVVERPGLGNSDFAESSFADWPNDVAQFADALGLDQFTLLGVSAGAPYAFACANAFPRRLRSVGILSGLGPLTVPGALDGMAPNVRLVFTVALQAPQLVPLTAVFISSVFHASPSLYMQTFTSGMSAPDRAIFKRAEIKQMPIDMMQGAFQSGIRGVVQDLLRVSKPWHPVLPDNGTPVYLWHGESDNIVPPSHARYIANAIPHLHAHFYPNEGHFSLAVCRLEEILGELLC